MAAGQLVTYQASEIIWTPTSAKEKAAAACAAPSQWNFQWERPEGISDAMGHGSPPLWLQLSCTNPGIAGHRALQNVRFEDLIRASSP